MTSSRWSTVWLIRHGQSAANAGLPVSDFAAIPLTSLGREQARLFAERFDELSPLPPTRIIRSPYLRAMQTAEPFVERFPEVPVENWPVQEFTFLDPKTSRGLNELERSSLYAEFWQRDDPEFANPNGAESFTQFMNRVREALARFTAMPCGERVTVFTHGYFMQGVRLTLLFPELTDRERMSASRVLDHTEPIANTEILELRIEDGRIRALHQEHITPLTLERVLSHR